MSFLNVLAVIVLLIILLFFAAPAFNQPPNWRVSAIRSLSNQRQLVQLAQQMALDGETSGNKHLGWPGDIGGTYSNWTTQLLTNGYVSTNELCQLLSFGGKPINPNSLFDMESTAIRFYAVRESSPTNTVFSTSANFTNTPSGGTPLNPEAIPFGNRGIVVFRKSGEGSIIPRKEISNTSFIGGFAPLFR